MKKILFALLGGIFSFVACTNDQDSFSTANQNQSHSTHKSSGNSELDSLYNVMVTSPKYIAVQTARKDFADKMNFTGSLTSVDTETEVLSWINTNISITDFSSYSAAESEYYSIKNDYEVVIYENLLFWKKLQLNSNPRVAIGNLVEVEYDTMSADPCGCYDEYLYSTNFIHAQWAESIASLQAATDFSDFDSMDLFVDARNDMALCRDLSLGEAADNYVLCLYYCH